jgi:hypothetical protein
MNVPMALLRSFTWPQGVITTRSGTEYWFSREPKVNFTDPGIPAGRTEDDHHVTRAFYFGRSFLIITKPKAREGKSGEAVAAIA